jgi:hypothetical protein
MRAFAAPRHAAPDELTGRILCHDIRTNDGAIVLRKGHALRPDDLPILFDGGPDEIHLLELDPGDLGQRQAGQRLAEALCTPGLLPMPSGHRHVLRATREGLLDVDVAALQRMNSIPGIAVFTRLHGEVIAADQVVAHAQITPLAIAGEAVELAERIAREQPVVRVRPFVPRDAILWKRDDRIVGPLTETLLRFGCRLREIIDLPRDAASIRASLEARIDSGALLLVSGTNALDPLDPVFVVLEQIGAVMRRNGLPVHPGTLFWIATRGDITIAGLPTCGIGGQVTAFDLVLPRLLIGEGAFFDDLAGLGHGGILSHTRGPVLDEEPVDDPVR